MRNGLIQLLAPVTDGSKKNHELLLFKRTIEKLGLRQQVLWVADRGYMDFRWWEKQKRKGNFIISRAKSNRSATYCGENPFDREDPVNTGVIRDSMVGFSNTASTFRMIEYINPETDEEIVFYTTLGSKIRKAAIVCQDITEHNIQRPVSDIFNITIFV